MNQDRQRPKPPEYPEHLRNLGGIHLALGRLESSQQAGVAYHPERGEFTFYTFFGWLDKDGHASAHSAEGLLQFERELHEIGAGWLVPVARRMAADSAIGLDAIVAGYREVYGWDPRGYEDYRPRRPWERPRPSPFRHEAQYERIRALVAGLADPNLEKARQSVQKLATMGVTEDQGPLFAREALWLFRKHRLEPGAPSRGHAPD
jgi:hypothetical protein